jgi:nitrate reductase NapD
MGAGEYHVASYVVSTRPDDADRVAGRIESMPGLEVHAREQGKLVVTAEADSIGKLADVADELTGIEAVVTVAPVYHEYDEAAGKRE